MAISVRSCYNNKSFKTVSNYDSNVHLLPESCSEVDHYLIETLAGGLIRLEGSPFTFKSLPLLLQHYCLNG